MILTAPIPIAESPLPAGLRDLSCPNVPVRPEPVPPVPDPVPEDGPIVTILGDTLILNTIGGTELRDTFTRESTAGSVRYIAVEQFSESDSFGAAFAAGLPVAREVPELFLPAGDEIINWTPAGHDPPGSFDDSYFELAGGNVDGGRFRMIGDPGWPATTTGRWFTAAAPPSGWDVTGFDDSLWTNIFQTGETYTSGMPAARRAAAGTSQDIADVPTGQKLFLRYEFDFSAAFGAGNEIILLETQYWEGAEIYLNGRLFDAQNYNSVSDVFDIAVDPTRRFATEGVTDRDNPTSYFFDPAEWLVDGRNTLAVVVHANAGQAAFETRLSNCTALFDGGTFFTRPVLANHDNPPYGVHRTGRNQYITSGLTAPEQFNLLPLPFGGRRYSVSEGEVTFHFFSTQTARDRGAGTSNSFQAQWLRQAVASSSTRWNFVVTDEPIAEARLSPQVPTAFEYDWLIDVPGLDGLIRGKSRTSDNNHAHVISAVGSDTFIQVHAITAVTSGGGFGQTASEVL